MLAIQPSPSTPRFAFSPDDEVKIRDISYRPHERRPDGYIMGRSDGTGAAEFFEDGKLRHLVQKGVLHHEPGAFLSDAERRRRAPRRSVISAAPEAIAHRSKLRLAYVEAFLELEARREIKRTDAAIKAAMGRLQMRATEILGLQNRDERGDRNTCVLAKPVAAISLRRWLKDYEAEGLEGLFDALHRSGNRSRKIGLEELGVMGPLVQRYARENVPKEIIFQDVKSTFETLNEERARKKLAPLEVPSRETIRREIDRLDPYQVHVAHKGEASARKKFAPVGTGLQLTRPLERVEMDEWTIDLISLVTKGGLGKHLTDEDKRQLGLDRKTIRWKASAAICSTTRCIVAMRLTPSATSHSAIQTIDMITRDKGVWTDTFSALSPWDMAGVPELIVTDCGSNFVSYETRAAMQDLGIRVERAPAGVPEVHGRIERFFLTAITSLLPRLRRQVPGA
jgi:putative transposase